MSFDYTATVIVGFKINNSELFTAKTIKRDSCSCEERNGHKHCPNCGRKVETVEGYVLATKKRYDHLITRDENGCPDYSWSSTFFERKVEILNLSNPDGDEMWFVGVYLAGIDVKCCEYKRCTPTPDITEKSLAVYLKDQGVPFNPNTFGIHVIGQIH